MANLRMSMSLSSANRPGIDKSSDLLEARAPIIDAFLFGQTIYTVFEHRCAGATGTNFKSENEPNRFLDYFKQLLAHHRNRSPAKVSSKENSVVSSRSKPFCTCLRSRVSLAESCSKAPSRWSSGNRSSNRNGSCKQVFCQTCSQYPDLQRKYDRLYADYCRLQNISCKKKTRFAYCKEYIAKLRCLQGCVLKVTGWFENLVLPNSAIDENSCFNSICTEESETCRRYRTTAREVATDMEEPVPSAPRRCVGASGPAAEPGPPQPAAGCPCPSRHRGRTYDAENCEEIECECAELPKSDLISIDSEQPYILLRKPSAHRNRRCQPESRVSAVQPKRRCRIRRKPRAKYVIVNASETRRATFRAKDSQVYVLVKKPRSSRTDLLSASSASGCDEKIPVRWGDSECITIPRRRIKNRNIVLSKLYN